MIRRSRAAASPAHPGGSSRCATRDNRSSGLPACGILSSESPVVGDKAMVAVGDVLLKDHGQGVMDLIASDAVLDEAYAWLCDRRKDYSPHDNIWTLRERWADVKPRLQRSLLWGEYRCA